VEMFLEWLESVLPPCGRLSLRACFRVVCDVVVGHRWQLAAAMPMHTHTGQRRWKCRPPGGARRSCCWQHASPPPLETCTLTHPTYLPNTPVPAPSTNAPPWPRAADGQRCFCWRPARPCGSAAAVHARWVSWHQPGACREPAACCLPPVLLLIAHGRYALTVSWRQPGTCREPAACLQCCCSLRMAAMHSR